MAQRLAYIFLLLLFFQNLNSASFDKECIVCNHIGARDKPTPTFVIFPTSSKDSCGLFKINKNRDGIIPDYELNIDTITYKNLKQYIENFEYIDTDSIPINKHSLFLISHYSENAHPIHYGIIGVGHNDCKCFFDGWARVLSNYEAYVNAMLEKIESVNLEDSIELMINPQLHNRKKYSKMVLKPS